MRHLRDRLTGWGNYDAFLEYTAKVNPYLPLSVIPTVGQIVDVAEISIAVLLLVGFRIKETAFLSGVMLFLFAFGMNLGVGVISTLDHSVYTACVASFVLPVGAVDSTTPHRSTARPERSA